MHRPETWGYVQFSSRPAGDNVNFKPDPAAPARYLLHKVHYAQQEYLARHGEFAKKLSDLDVGQLWHPSLAKPLHILVFPDKYRATAEVKLANGQIRKVHITQDAEVWTR